MSSELWGVSSGADLNCLLTAPHKRGGCNPSFCVPEAKRQQLSSLFDCDLPALEGEDKEDQGANMLSATSLMPVNSVVGPCLPNTLNEEQANIANSSHYIDSLLDIMGAADDFNENVRDLPDVNPDPIEEDDLADEMLSNLPTSVDDFQAKEFNLKLERNSTGTPLISRRQSPIGGQLDVSNSSAASECGLITSRTHSVSSNPQIVGDLDADDLEVAMINESFEEQQKQSKIYGGVSLKSLFYGMPQECDDSQLDEIIFNAKEHKTSNASKVVNLSHSDSEGELEDEDEDFFEEEDAENSTPPIDISSNEFVPLLTPKSREFIHPRKSSLKPAPSKAIDIPSASKSSSAKMASTTIYQQEDDEEKSRRLDMELEKMMLEGEEDLYPPSFEEETQFATPTSCQQPENSAAVAEAVVYGVVESLFNSPMDPEDTLAGASQSKNVSEEEKILLSESLLKDMDADDSFLDGEEDSFGNLLSEKCGGNETPDTSGHFSADGCDLLKVPCKKGSNCSSLYADDSSGHSSSATISSSSSGNCSNNDEQKVPVVDSWEELEDSAVAVNMLNELKNAFEVARMSKQDHLLSSGMSEQQQELSSLTHVLEASTNSPKTEPEMSGLIEILGFGQHTWCKKVDDRHYLLVFPTPAKASETLFSNSKRSNGVKLQLLFDASEQSRSKASKWKSILKAKPTGPRPQTTASVARRMIANSLNMRIDVSTQQRNKEAKQMAAAKEQKLQKNAIWGEND